VTATTEATGTVAVCGTGVMARGLARLCLARGMDLVLVSGSSRRAEALAAELAAQGPRRRISADPRDVGTCSVVLEATVEALGPKKEVLRRMEAGVSGVALLATTTSSLSVTELGSALEAPERFLGLHFFNPVHRMRLVEVVGGLRTSPEALDRGRTFTEAIGKHPLAVPDRAGFLVNRLLIRYLNQAARLVEAGVASVEDVDTAMRLGAGHPMGPFALIDLIGADVCLAIGSALFEEFHTTADSPSSELRRRVLLGWLGRKSGRGYYDYESGGESGS
jgi:3-hydroxybutyryl-CoA dehydrogenase